MRRALIGLATFAIAGSIAVAAPSAANSTSAQPVRAKVIATFGTTESFAESATLDAHGDAVASVTHWGAQIDDTTWTDNVGQLYLVRPDGRKSTYGPEIALGGCAMILGVDLDASGAAVVAVFNFDASCGTSSPATGLVRVTSHRVTRLSTFPDGSWPNGVEVVGRTAYVTESLSGAVYAVPVDRVSVPARPWFTSPLLAPLEDPIIGANGVAFRDGALWLTSYAQGLVLRLPLRRDGSPGTARVVAADPRLVTADGIAFDPHGVLWVSVNHRTLSDGSLDRGHLVTVSPRGSVRDVAFAEGLVDYPTQVLFAHHGRMLVVNGSYLLGTPSLLRITR
jgi:hypothetical protein